MPEASPDITLLLRHFDEGRPGAADELMRAVYDDLSRVAKRHLDQRFGPGLPGVTLEPAALVNESFLRLIRQRKAFDNRGQFFAIATRIMLRVLLDYQRSRQAARRGGDRQHLALDLERDAESVGAGTGGVGSMGTGATGDTIAVEALVSALDRLEALDQRKADVVKLRVVWGLQMREVAEALGVSLATVERDWAFAKAWLAREAGRRASEP